MRYEETNEQANLFDFINRLSGFGQVDTPLDRLNRKIDWESFRPQLEKILEFKSSKKGGRPPKDPVRMFKVIVLQDYYGLSDEQTEFQISDRLSFQRFLGLNPSNKIPDQKTIWLFKERLGSEGVRQLFDSFKDHLSTLGVVSKPGKIIDATFVEAPRQRNSREENAQIKVGERPASFDENPNRGEQKDTDARWAKKNDETHFGYKDHIKVSAVSNLIEDYTTTPASCHDSIEAPKLTQEGDGDLFADSAYQGEPIARDLASKNITSFIHEKGTRDHPLTEVQKSTNTIKSSVRVYVEHVFGWLTQHGDLFVRTIGIERAKRYCGLRNLVYNLFRWEQLGRCESKSLKKTASINISNAVMA